jgi:hypothetical protein
VNGILRAAAPSSSGARIEPLRLTSVLVSGLPPELGTSHAPARYTVPAVFSRQVGGTERTRIESPETARRLSDHAGAPIELVVADRRLLIKHTTLDELRDGLAAEIAAVLQDIADDLEHERKTASAASEALAHEERDRADRITRQALDVVFE